jgi:uncharacterized membrane protein YidH (DUF202 family)
MARSERRFGIGSFLTVSGAVLIVVSLPMTWYHAERATNTELSGWGMFTNLRIWLVSAAALAVLSALLRQGWGAVIARAALGLLAGGPVLRRIVQPPGHGVRLDDRVGLFVALLGAVAIVAGGLLSAGRRVAEHYGFDLPGRGPVRALPPAEPPPSPPGGNDALVVDAEVVSER